MVEERVSGMDSRRLDLYGSSKGGNLILGYSFFYSVISYWVRFRHIANILLLIGL